MALNAVVPSLKLTRWQIGSHCSCCCCRSVALEWSGTWITTWVSEFWTHWSPTTWPILYLHYFSCHTATKFFVYQSFPKNPRFRTPKSRNCQFSRFGNLLGPMSSAGWTVNITMFTLHFSKDSDTKFHLFQHRKRYFWIWQPGYDWIVCEMKLYNFTWWRTFVGSFPKFSIIMILFLLVFTTISKTY